MGPDVTTIRRPASAPPRGRPTPGGSGMDGRRLQRAFDRRDDRQRFGHAARAEFAAGHLAVVRPDEQHAVAAQGRNVALGGGVQPHAHVHRRRDQHALVGRQQRRRGEIVGEAERHAREEVGGRRRDDEEVGLARELDVAHARLFRRGEQVGAHRLAAERLGRKGRDELLGGGGHGDAHRRAAFAQAADQVERLVGRDAAADDQQDAGARECLCGHASGLRGAAADGPPRPRRCAVQHRARINSCAMAKLRPAAPCR